MKSWKRIFSLCALAATALPAAAMYVDPRGTGEVLLFPYYTVNAGQATLISLTNTTGKAKYLTANIREGYNSRMVLNLNIILSPYDSWTATLYSGGDNDRATLLTRDGSCTLPIKENAWTPAIGSGWQLGLDDRAYTGRFEDGGPTDLGRTREGHITIVERAELAGTLAAAAGQPGGRNCALLQVVSPAHPDLRPPGGGLYGNFSIVNVAQGTLLGGSATAIADFADQPLFWDTADLKELLALGSVDADGQAVSAQVFTDGRLLDVAYPHIAGQARAIDATSALLMTEALYGEFERDDDYGSRSEWVITAPTKFMYTDREVLVLPPGSGDPALPPFRDIFDSVNEGGSCMPFTASGADREGRSIRFDPPTALSPPPLAPRYPSHSLCHAVDVVYFDNDPQNPYNPPPPLGQSHSTPVLGSRLGASVWHPVAFPPNDLTPFRPTVGSLKLELGVRREGGVSWDGGGPESGPSFLPPGTRGPGLRGLPVIGFQAVRYINANALPGVLANYTRALPLQSSSRCTDAAGAAVDCP
jgi:hypothetical protein